MTCNLQKLTACGAFGRKRPPVRESSNQGQPLKKPDAKVVLAIALTLLGLLICWASLHESAVFEDQVAENLAIRSAIKGLLAGTIEAASGARGFGATGQARFLASFKEGEKSIAEHLAVLESFTRNLPEERVRLNKTKLLIDARLQVARDTIAQRNKLARTPAPELFVRGEEAMEAVRKSIREMEDVQIDLLEQHQRRAMLARHWTTALVLCSLVVGILMLFLATSARQEARGELSLLKAALEATANAVLITNHQGTIEWVNPAFSHLTGYSSDEVVGLTPNFLRSGKHSREFYQHMWTTILAGDVWSGEVTNRRKDGTLYCEEMTITPVRSAGDGYSHYVAIKKDVTEKQQLEAKSRQAQKMEAIGTLAGGVAHDLNNWLTVIEGNVDMLYQLLPQDLILCVDELEDIRNAAKSAGTLTKQLLAFSRNQVLQPRVITPNAVISETAQLLNRLLGEDISLSLELAPDAGNVRVDPSQLQQVILNLAVNARDAMPKGGSLNISTANCEFVSMVGVTPQIVQPGSYVRLCLRDTGTGMDEITLQRAFEPFFTTKPLGKGTGLGLATVYGIIKQSGGCIFLHSEPGKGTEVEVLLPVAPRDVDKNSVMDTKARNGNESILVVEDNEPLRRLVCGGLRKSGYVVFSAANGADAMTQMRDVAVDLLITDCIMPGMDGAELARRLTREHPKMNVLYMSGHPEETLGDKGAVDPNLMLLKKPFDMPDLLTMVRKALEIPATALAS
ncbi:MAG TPA: response regulator [Dongiaceae bacterium]|nr:response regulator [Dongiaceae bacterium]